MASEVEPPFVSARKTKGGPDSLTPANATAAFAGGPDSAPEQLLASDAHAGTQPGRFAVFRGLQTSAFLSDIYRATLEAAT
jgi:hypothetical protein